MHSTSFTLALAGVASLASAATPPNFQPASNGELIIAFGNTLATQGVDLPKACKIIVSIFKKATF